MVMVLGVILIISGVIAYLALRIPTSYPTLVSVDAMTVRAGSSTPRTYHLPVDAYVYGHIDAVSGGNGDIDFYVFDKSNYDLWSNGQTNVRYVFIYRASSGTQFSFRTDKEADYSFVFDNPVGWPFGSDRSVNWSAWYEYKPYAPYALPIFALLFVVGVLLVVGPLFAELKRKQKLEKLRICPNCSQRIPIERAICPYCGFDVSKSIRCEYCKTLYDRSLPKCPNCGARNK